VKYLSVSRQTRTGLHRSTRFSMRRFYEVYNEIRKCPRYEPTPLLSLEQLAELYGIAAIYVKDERRRFGLRSFKALGGPYAVLELARQWQSERSGREILIDDLLKPERQPLKELVVICASAGNHGQGVAAGARLIGAPCKIFLPENTAEKRKEAIRVLGAEIITVGADYDAAVTEAFVQAREHNWLFVPDSSLHGDSAAPELVMLAYGTIIREAYDQILTQNLRRPTHLFIQAGVGSLAGALAAYSAEKWADERPRFVVVEPMQADCLMESAIAGTASHTRENLKTGMTGLACGYASPMAWEILSEKADGFVAVSDEEVNAVLKDLGEHKPLVETSLSGAAGLAPLRLSRNNRTLAEALRLVPDSVVLGVITEAP